MLFACTSPAAAQAADTELLEKFALQISSEVWTGDFRRLQWIYKLKDKLAVTPNLLQFMFTVLEIKSGQPKLEQLILADVGERHFKPAFALIIENLESATLSKKAVTKFQQLMQTSIYDYETDSLDLYRRIQHVLSECTFKLY